MSKLNIMYKFIGVDKKVFASTSFDDMSSMFKHVLDADYANIREVAQQKSGTDKFGIGGYYLFDYYLSNKIPDPISEGTSQRWFDKIKETLSNYKQHHKSDYKYSCDDDTIKHISNIISLHMRQCFDIIHSDDDLLKLNGDKYIMFHMFIDRDLINQLNIIKEKEEDPFDHWLLTTFIRDVFISGMESFNMIDETDEHDVNFEVCDINDAQKVYVSEDDGVDLISEETPEYLS